MTMTSASRSRTSFHAGTPQHAHDDVRLVRVFTRQPRLTKATPATLTACSSCRGSAIALPLARFSSSAAAVSRGIFAQEVAQRLLALVGRSVGVSTSHHRDEVSARFHAQPRHAVALKRHLLAVWQPAGMFTTTRSSAMMPSSSTTVPSMAPKRVDLPLAEQSSPWR